MTPFAKSGPDAVCLENCGLLRSDQDLLTRKGGGGSHPGQKLARNSVATGGVKVPQELEHRWPSTGVEKASR